MEEIRDIFFGVQESENETLIKPVKVADVKLEKLGILNIASHFETKFVMNDSFSDVMLQLYLYFTGSKVSKLDLNKGILIIGEVGTGKSLLMKIYQNYTKFVINTNSFIYEMAIDIIDNVNVSGAGYLEQYGNNIIGGKAYPKTIYIDDIASKNETIKHFGTELNVIEQLLSLRYNLFSRYRTLTHASTNKFPSEMSDIYDKRIIDRMIEMFNIIELNGESNRK